MDHESENAKKVWDQQGDKVFFTPADYVNPYKRRILLCAVIFGVSVTAYFATKHYDVLNYPVLYAGTAFVFGARMWESFGLYKEYKIYKTMYTGKQYGEETFKEYLEDCKKGYGNSIKRR